MLVPAAFAPPVPNTLRDEVAKALAGLPTTLPSPESTVELKRALDDLAAVRIAVNDPLFPGLPKPPSDQTSLAPLPLVDMISASAPQAKKRKEEELQPTQVGKVETEVKEKKVDTPVKMGSEDAEGEMDVDEV